MDGRQIPAARTERLVIEPVGEELLVYDLERDRAHSLDTSATAIWRACDGTTPMADIALRAGVSEDVARSTLEHLAEIKLLAEPLVASPGHSRRALLRRGLVAGAAGVAAVPVIKSIVAPTTAAAGSAVTCLPDGAVCTQSVQCCPGLICCCETPTCFCRPPGLCNE